MIPSANNRIGEELRETSAMFLQQIMLRLVLTAAFCSLPGCVTPIARQIYEPNPVRTERAIVYVHEIRRGPMGGVISLRVQNVANETLEWASGADIDIQILDGTLARNLSAQEFDAFIVENGPRSLGYGYWPSKTKKTLVTLDRHSPRVDLDCGESTLLETAFVADRTVRTVTLNLGHALSWRRANGATVEIEQPILVNIDLPEVPDKGQPNLEFLSRIHGRVEISSDM